MIDWNGRRHISTQGELAEVLGRPAVCAVLGDEVPYEPEVCLCPVDLESLFDAFGLDWERTNDIPEYRVHITDQR